jgi:CHAT domain-containing protein/tetratricopeptide (TPR) repeat protein
MSGAGRLGDRRRELRKPSLTLAVVAGIIATASCGAPAEPPTPADLLAELERALPSRILEARLSIRQPAEGCTPIPEEYTATCTFPESGSREYLRLAQATNDAQTIGRAGGSAENLRLEGLALLLWSSRQEGTVERAVTRLEAAAELAPRDPDILSDLAAGHLEADRQTESNYHLPRALDAAVRALELAPDHAPALFNSALALERLGLPEEALEGWREYLQQDPESPWTGEVGQRAGSIEEEIATPRIGAGDVMELVGEGDLDGLRRLAQEDPQLARTVAMDRLLPEWAEKHVANRGAEADSLLQSSSALGEGLPDGTVALAISEIRTALEAPPGSGALDQLVRGWSRYADGRSEYDRVRDVEAVAAFREAARSFGEAGSAMASWSRMWLANAELGLLNYETAGQLVAGVLMEAPGTLPALRGLSHRAGGVLALRRGSYARAFSEYGQAEAAMVQAGERSNAASSAGLKAEAQKFLGDPLPSWNPRIQALRVHGGYRSGLRTHQTLHDAADAAALEGRLSAAIRLQTGVLRLATENGTPEFVAEAYVRRGRMHLSRADSAEASRDAVSAREAVASVQVAEVASWMWADLWRLEASLASPDERAALLASALAVHERAGHDHILATLLLERVRVARGVPHLNASSDLLRAVELLEATTGSMTSASDRVRLAEARRTLADLAAEMVVEGEVQPLLGLELIERVSLAAWASPGNSPAVVRLEEWARPDLAAVRYYTLPRQVLTWVVTDEDVLFIHRPLEARELTSSTEALVASVRRAGAWDGGDGAARSLADLLLPPRLWEHVGQRNVAIVPDGVTGTVPFALLPGASGGPMMEERVVSLAPTLRAALGAGPDWEAGLTEEATFRVALVAPVVGVPTLQLPPLPATVGDVQRLKEFYRSAQVLLADEATVDAFVRELATADLLHFAGHAVSGADDSKGAYLVLARADSAGEVALYGDDLLELAGTMPPLVILAACSSIAPDGESRGGGFWGLARHFMEGGTRTVIGTLWNVPDQEASDFSLLLHHELRRGLEPSLALARAQAVAREESLIPPRTWAAFQVLIGGD